MYGKVFRHRFSLNRQMKDSMQTDAYFVHPEFRFPCFEDVTRLYATDKSHTLTIGKEHFTREMGKGSLVYLCMSNRYDWKPVGWCRYDGQAAVFNDCHGGTVYCLASYDAGSKKLVTLSHPFSVDVDSAKMEFYEPEKETEDVVLFSKFGMIGEFFLGRMVGGVFEGSRSPGFEHPDTLFRIKDMPLRLCTAVRVDSTKTYRYVRYFGPRGGFGNVSEVGFYSSWADTEPLKGDILGPQEGAHGSHSYFNVFDGHTDTSYDHPFDYGGWAGLDLGEKKAIGKIVYTPRNRDNFVGRTTYTNCSYAMAGNGNRQARRLHSPIRSCSGIFRNMLFCCCVILAVAKPNGCLNTRMAYRSIGNKNVNNVLLYGTHERL